MNGSALQVLAEPQHPTGYVLRDVRGVAGRAPPPLTGVLAPAALTIRNVIRRILSRTRLGSG